MCQAISLPTTELPLHLQSAQLMLLNLEHVGANLRPQHIGCADIPVDEEFRLIVECSGGGDERRVRQ